MFRFFNPVNVQCLRASLSSPRFLTATTGKNISQADRVKEAQHQFDTVLNLYNNGQLEQALSKISYIETQFPECSKAVKYYRGKISVKLLEQNGELDDLKEHFRMK